MRLDNGSTVVSIASGDVTLKADAIGDPTNIPVVLLHGGGQTRHAWGATARDLAADGWYAMTVDQRGHGESDWSAEGRYDLDDYANDVARIVDWLGRPPVLVGASLGGCAALAALGRHPELARGLVLVDVAPFLRRSGRARIREFMSASPEGFGSLEEAADAVAEFLPYRTRPASPEGLRRNLRERDGRLYWHWDPAFLSAPGDDTVTQSKFVDPVRLGAAAVTLRIPTLLVRGAASEVLGMDDAVRLLRLVPHVDFREVSNARHMVAGDDNVAFGTVLGDFLQRRIRCRYDLLQRHELASRRRGSQAP